MIGGARGGSFLWIKRWFGVGVRVRDRGLSGGLKYTESQCSANDNFSHIHTPNYACLYIQS